MSQGTCVWCAKDFRNGTCDYGKNLINIYTVWYQGINNYTTVSTEFDLTCYSFIHPRWKRFHWGQTICSNFKTN